MYEELQTSNEEGIKTKYEKIILLKNDVIDYSSFIIKYNYLINLEYSDYQNINIRNVLKDINPDYTFNN